MGLIVNTCSWINMEKLAVINQEIHENISVIFQVPAVPPV